MSFKFEKLEIWNLAIEFTNEVHLITRKFPKEEIFSLTSQFKRATDSIALNISEGSMGHSDLEQERFLQYSLWSVAECISCLYLAKKETTLTIMNLNYFMLMPKQYLRKLQDSSSILKNHSLKNNKVLFVKYDGYIR